MDLVKKAKVSSTRWIKNKDVSQRGFYWQNGYGSFSISPSQVNPLVNYIANQEEHHRKEPFQDEFRRLLNMYNLDYDERYVWG